MMQIDISGQNVEVTQALRAYVTEKLERLERHFDNLTGVHVVQRLEKIEHTAEATVGVGGRTNSRCEALRQEHIARFGHSRQVVGQLVHVDDDGVCQLAYTIFPVRVIPAIRSMAP